jgi:hypothetical protein
MSLLSVDISKANRLSLTELRLPAPQRRLEPVKPTQPIPRPPTEEELIYSKLVAINPLIEELVETLDLVSITTGQRIRRVELPVEEQPTQPDSSRLLALAQSLLKPQNSYTKKEIIERIAQGSNVSEQRAETGFTLLLRADIIAPTLGDTYYLADSTPF